MAISPMPFPDLPGAIGSLNAGMSGMTMQQAWEAQNMSVPSHIGFGVSDWTSSKPSITGHTESTITDSSETDPIDAWEGYVEDESTKVSDVTGGIVDGSNVATFAYSLVEKYPQVGVSAVEAIIPVAVPVEQAYVAIGQVLGVSMDAAEMEVETKQKYSNSIMRFNDLVYDAASGLVKAWWDGVNILFPKATIDAVYDLIETEGWGAGGIEGQVPDDNIFGIATFPITQTAKVIGRPPLETAANVYIHSDIRPFFVHNGTCTVFSDSPMAQLEDYILGEVKTDGNLEYVTQSYFGSRASRYTYEGKTVYYKNMGQSLGQYPPYDPEWGPSSPFSYDKAAWLAQYGGYTHQGTPFPNGTEESQAPSYTPSTVPIYGNLAISENETIPLVPTNLPATDNTIGSTLDPTSQSDPNRVKELPPAPVPIPIPDTIPSNPSVPLTDPSVVNAQLINELVEELANTLDPQPAQSSGIIPVPLLPGISDPTTGERTFPSIIPSSGPGFIHVYNPTPAEFMAFGSWLWVTYADATIDKILNNPFDGVIGAHELYATPNTDGSDNIRSAFLTCPTTAALVPNRYSEIDCGTVIVPEFYGNYLDYSPYSQAYIYLPFIGINEVSIDDIVGHAVNIRYRVDSYSGSCIAMIFVAKDGYQNLCYQFAGNCSVEVPMAGGSQAAIKAGMMQAEAYARAAMVSAAGHLLGGVGSALMGSIGGALSSVAGIASDYGNAKAGVEAARVANKSSVQHSGQFGASHGAMGQKIPFIIIRNPVQVKVVNYNDDYGYPAHKRVIIGGCTGYLRVREVNVISAHATDEEKAAIEALLKNGVYVS